MRTTVSTGTTHTFPSPIEKSKKELEISNAEYDIQECEFYVNPVLLTDVDIEPEFMKDAARPLGASIGDLLSQSKKDGGIGLGTTTTSAIFLTIILGLVVYLTRSRKDAIPLDKALAD